MEPARFDALVQTLTRRGSRRRALGLLLSAGLLAPAAPLAARTHKKKRCRPACAGGMVCHRGTCGCPPPQEACGGQCYDPCQTLPGTAGQVAARHPVTCDCCLRPGSASCEQLGSLPCCAQACDPRALHPMCEEFPGSAMGCHEDVECAPGRHCPPGDEPRLCQDIPG
jgi:hypothetical protein